MCGIFGAFAREGVLGDTAPLCEAANLLAHRGPDDGSWWSEGPFFLGHRRLSIIDIDRGNQPMVTDDGRFVIVFNGEIYNYVELREELETAGLTFRTESDTEVILLGYRRWGVEVARRLVGMFAFGIVDRSEKTLYLARDRFGEKPLLVHESRRGIIHFASELKALAAIPDLERRLDTAALGGYLCLNYVPGEGTLMAGVRRVAPASWYLYAAESVRREIYWRPPLASGRMAVTDNDVHAELKRRIDESIRITLRSDVPVTLFLSGGVDSSIVAESATRQGKIGHAYVLDFDETGFSELPGATFVSKQLGLELRRAVLSARDLRDFFSVVEHADDPLADSSALAVWAISREVARQYKVAISGDGGDEIFGGYLTYKATKLHALIAAMLPRSLRAGLAALSSRVPVSAGKVTTSYKLMRFLRAIDLPPSEAHFTWNGSWLPSQASKLISDAAASAHARGVLQSLLAEEGEGRRPTLSALQIADVREYLANDILVKVDRMTMAHGLEARAPFLVPDVAEFGLQLPDRHKLGLLGAPKRILRELATSLYGPRIGHAPKQGFSIPVHQWLRGPARALADELLAPEEIRAIGALDVEAVMRLKQLHMSGRAQLGFELWGLMVLVAWHRTRISTGPRTAQAAPLRRVRIGAAGQERHAMMVAC